MVDKWYGSIEVGVTTHSPLTLEFPSTMTDIDSGTLMMTGQAVIHNGTILITNYGENLDELTVSDTNNVQVKSQWCRASSLNHNGRNFVHNDLFLLL